MIDVLNNYLKTDIHDNSKTHKNDKNHKLTQKTQNTHNSNEDLKHNSNMLLSGKIKISNFPKHIQFNKLNYKSQNKLNDIYDLKAQEIALENLREENIKIKENYNNLHNENIKLSHELKRLNEENKHSEKLEGYIEKVRANKDVNGVNEEDIMRKLKKVTKFEY